MPKLSVAMIVKNEAAVLADCLESVAPIADEIVIGDTGSTDNTVEIACHFGARVFDVPWTNDFAAARNAVLREATGDWCLHMDADEVLDPAGAERIREIVDSDGAGADGIWVTLANYCNNPRAWRFIRSDPSNSYTRDFAGYIAVEIVRLFRKRPGIEYREALHETLAGSLEETGAILRRKPILIHHYGFSPDKEKKTAKTRMYLDIAREKIRKRPSDWKSWFELACAAGDLKETGAAIDAARKAVELAPTEPDAIYTLVINLTQDRQIGAARAVLERYAKSGPVAVPFVALLADLALAEGDLPAAKRWTKSVLDADGTSVSALLTLARILDQEGNGAKARAALARALEAAPHLQEAQLRLKAHDLRTRGEAFLVKDRPELALRRFVAAMELDLQDPILHRQMAQAFNALDMLNEGEEALSRAAKLAPALVAPSHS